MNTVDIMLPYYSNLPLLQATVRSIVAQVDHNWRLTVVDDGEMDARVPDFLASLNDPKIRYMRNRSNLGINRNFQRCVDLIEADTAVIMGADDVMLPNYIGLIRDLRAAHPGAAMIQPGVEIVDEKGSPATSIVDLAKKYLYAPRIRSRTELGGEPLAASLLRGNWLYFPSLAWRSESIRSVGFTLGLNVVQDLALVLELVRRGEHLVVDPTVAFRYRRHRASVSSWRALDGTRFIEERDFFLAEADRMAALDWNAARRLATLHLSSRLNALSMLPLAVRKRHRTGVKVLSRHVFASSRSRELEG